MIGKSKLLNDKEVIRAIFDEAFLYKTIVDKYTRDKEHRVTKILLEKGYFNCDVKIIQIAIFKNWEHSNCNEGFSFRVNEQINRNWYSNEWYFSKDFIDDWQYED